MKSYVTPMIIALSIITGVFVLGNAYKYKFKTNETIICNRFGGKGFYQRPDRMVRRLQPGVTMDLKSAYTQLKNDENTIRHLPERERRKDEEMVFSAVSINKIFNTRYSSDGEELGSDFGGYNLKQDVTVDSKDIDKVEKISREVTG